MGDGRDSDGLAGTGGTVGTDGTVGTVGLHLSSFDAVSLDVGGVLVVPNHGLLASALAAAGVSHDEGRFLEGHYRAMAEVDRCRSRPEEFTDYTRGFLRAVGVADDQIEAGRAALAPVHVSAVWHQPVPGALAAARRLAAAGLRLAITSNSDGTVAEMLARHEVAQLGDGVGLPVEHISDSGVVGAAKPDPAIFLATARGLGLSPERICHVGDGGCYDADGAAAVGMVAVHVDPLGLCPSDHHHVASLVDLADALLGRDPDVD
jgi:FMN phosphatase YigB (HAD superfamily)